MPMPSFATCRKQQTKPLSPQLASWQSGKFLLLNSARKVVNF